eukprot:6087263-Amphidinium_carterae.1
MSEGRNAATPVVHAKIMMNMTEVAMEEVMRKIVTKTRFREQQQIAAWAKVAASAKMATNVSDKPMQTQVLQKVARP